jgi:hypothetical protein
VIQMKILIMLILAFNGFSGLGIADDGEVDYSQTYIIFIDGARAGKETVTERTDDKGNRIVESENEIYLTDGLETNRMAYTTRMVLDGKSLKPKSYVYKYATGNTGDSYEVSIQGDSITRTLYRGGEASDATASFQPDTVILEYNVYHQYDYVLQKYDSKIGGRQLFSDFIPVVGSHIPIALTFIGASNLPIKNGTLPVKKYRIEFVGIRSGTVTSDSSNRLISLEMPDENLEVVRDDILPANR